MRSRNQYPAIGTRIGWGTAAAAGLVAIALGVAHAGAGRTAPNSTVGATSAWTDAVPRLDGRGSDRVWRSARPLPAGGASGGGDRSSVRFAWDHDALYFFVETEDRDVRGGPDGDAVTLWVQPAADRPGRYAFRVGAAGAVSDRFLARPGDAGIERVWQAGEYPLEAKVSLRGTLDRGDDADRGWNVEGRASWYNLLRTGGRPAADEVWRYAIGRGVAEPGAGDWQPLQFTGPRPDPDLGVRLPLTTSKVAGTPDPPPPYRARRVLAHVALPSPMMVEREPGANRLYAILMQGSGITLVRFADDPAMKEPETLIKTELLAYDLEFHPDFARNGYLYLGVKLPAPAAGQMRRMAVVRYTIARTAPFGLDPKSARTIVEWPSDGHDGGAIGFGKDGMMYVTTGDGTSDSDTHVVGQDMSRLTAKLLRLDIEHPSPGREYSVPPDNPFVGQEGIRPETWAYGFRNPWRMTVDRETGHIWVGNNGQDQWETAYLIQKGGNYGWSVYEGSHPFYLTRKLGPTPHVKPTIEHPHSEFRSLTGGIVYYGSRYPELRGAYIYGDHSTGKIWGMKHDGTRVIWHRELADTSLQIAGFGTDTHDELLVADLGSTGGGGLYTLDATPRDLPPSTFPRRLSESGLFRAVKGHRVQPALIPYSVNAELWSDGAHKARFIALPGPDARIEVPPTGAWNFPDGTVIVKSFALEMEEGNSDSRRWIETRFLHREQAEWVGYSYLWNDAQTDAELVEAKGADRTYPIRVAASGRYPSGIREQTWHYPSRAECMSCHSRAANYVLGLSTLQLNRVHNYGKVRTNQLAVFEQLGVLRANPAQGIQDAIRAEQRARGRSEADANAAVSRLTAAAGQRSAPGPGSLLALTPDKLPRLVDPLDGKQALESRARSYLHANCAHCHVAAGGGNAAMELEFTTAREGTRIYDVKPLHDTYNLPDPRLVAPGRPDSSVLLHRISSRDRGYMPPVATARVDERAVRLFRDWIRSLPSAAAPAPK